MRPYDYDAFTTSLPSPYVLPAPSLKRDLADVVATLAIALGLAVAVPSAVIGLYVLVFVP